MLPGFTGRPLRRAALAAVIVGSIVFIGTNAHSDGPAVSDPNLKISGFGGGSRLDRNNDGIGGVAASFTFPFAHAFGVQLDGAYARIDNGNFGSTGAHVFWRNPTRGLLGVYVGYSRFDRQGGIDFGRAGGEGQYYHQQWTIDTAAGVKFGDIDQTYGRARLQFYPIDDLMLRAGWIYEGRSFANIGLEYQISTSQRSGVSLFVDGNLSNHDNHSVIGGLKITFGNSMSLKDRHRRQDPDSYAGFDQQASQDEARNRAARNNSTPQACPFTPASEFCSITQLQQPRMMGRFGIVAMGSMPTIKVIAKEYRVNQCQSAGYSPANPGPAACGCAAAFTACK